MFPATVARDVRRFVSRAAPRSVNSSWGGGQGGVAGDRGGVGWTAWEAVRGFRQFHAVADQRRFRRVDSSASEAVIGSHT